MFEESRYTIGGGRSDMDSALKIARENYIYSALLILAFGVSSALGAIKETFEVGMYFLTAYGALLGVIFVIIIKACRTSLHSQRLSRETRKQLFREHQLHGKHLILCFSMLIILPILFRYALHIEPLVSIQLGGFIMALIMGIINLRFALRMKIA